MKTFGRTVVPSMVSRWKRSWLPSKKVRPHASPLHASAGRLPPEGSATSEITGLPLPSYLQKRSDDWSRHTTENVEPTAPAATRDRVPVDVDKGVFMKR